MGSFFANLHVRESSQDAKSRLQNVARRLSGHLVGKGYRMAGLTPGEQIDRTVIIASPPQSKWVSVFDEDSDAPDLDALADLGTALCDGTVVITAVVADSDTLELSLYQNGQRTDRMKWAPGRRAPRLKRAAWERLLQSNVATFAASFSSGAAFAEEPVASLARLIGLDERLAHLGFRYRDDIGNIELVTLGFVAPKAEAYYKAREGPPRFVHYSGVVRPRMLIGTPSEGCGFLAGFYNEGGASRGAAVLLETSPIQDSLFQFQEFRFHLDGTQDRRVTATAERVSREDQVVYKATLPSLELPPWVEAIRNLRAAEYVRFNRIFQRANIQVQVQGLPIAAGTFQARMLFVPLQSRDGIAAVRFDVTIEAKPWW